MQDNVDTITHGQDPTKVSFSSPPVAAQPTLLRPSWHDAQMSNATGGPNLLTSKGQILNLILTSGIGALAGQAEAERGSPRTGYPGWGSSAMAGFSAPLQIAGNLRQQREQQAQQSQEAALRQAQVDAIPGQQAFRAAQLADTQSQTAERNARAAMYANADPNSSLDLMIAHAAGEALKAGRDPSTDPLVSKLQDVKSSSLKQAENDPEFRTWQQQNPNGNIQDWLRMRYPKQQINVGTGDTNDISVLAQGLVDGTLGGTILSRLPANVKLAAITAAKRLDPKFDMTNFANRQRVANDFGSGKSADQIQSFNTFLAHAQDLSNATNDFRATRSPAINKPMIWLKKNSGDPAVASYLAKTEPVRAEFETFLQNNHALTESDKASASKVLDDNYSPAQMQATLKSMTHTAALRLREVNKRYQNTMGRDYEGLLDPNNAQFLQDSGAMGSLQGTGGLKLKGTSGSSPQQGSNFSWDNLPTVK